MKRGPKATNPHERFMRHVRVTDGCWEWTGHLSWNGYALFWDGTKTVRASRFALGLAPNDPINACHHCDNGKCVKTGPDAKYPNGHLFIGTQKENLCDAANKGRMGHLWKSGEECPNSKLNADQVREIRRRYVRGVCTSEVLGKEFGVTYRAVMSIINGRTWKHV